MKNDDDFEYKNRMKQHRQYFLYPSKERKRMALLILPLTLLSGFIEFILFDKSTVAKISRYGMIFGFGLMLLALFAHSVS